MELLWEFIALQKPGYDEPCSIIFSDLCSGKVYSSCSSFVLSLNLAPTGDEHLRLYLLQSPLMISSSSLTHFKPRFFSPVDISAAVCDAQRVGSWPYKAMSALTRAGLMTLSPSWHYYHSQDQARDITPTNNNWKGEQKQKEWCFILAQFQFTAHTGQLCRNPTSWKHSSKMLCESPRIPNFQGPVGTYYN